MSNRKNIFSLAQNNQLTFKPSSSEKSQAINGKFKIRDNNLVYLVNESSSWRKQHKVANRLEFQGKWALDADYNLFLRLQKQSGIEKDRLALKGKIITCAEDRLIFQIKSKQPSGKQGFSSLKLKGIWRADRFNRLVFEVKKRDKPDILTFKECWEINRQQKLIYVHERTNLKTRTKSVNTLVFNGFWQVSEKNRLRYILSERKGSLFDFRVQAESSNLYPQKGIIKYRMGVGFKKGRKEKVVSLYGTWKFSRRGSLFFEMDYGQNQIRKMQFAANVNLSKKDRIIFGLRDKHNKSLGMTLTFKRALLPKKDLEYFVRLKKQGESADIGIGGSIRF
ncbi:MAG: hypothetical protein KAS87_03320 [Candidatus Omnitrophica bacterium]|nr:hypothetical protein [Candidatus Omnitrophota bacterium]